MKVSRYIVFMMAIHRNYHRSPFYHLIVAIFDICIKVAVSFHELFRTLGDFFRTYEEFFDHINILSWKVVEPKSPDALETQDNTVPWWYTGQGALNNLPKKDFPESVFPIMHTVP